MTQAAKIGVVGVGTMGSQTMWRLAERGAQVVGFEQFAPGHDRSAAGGESRIFRSAHFEDSRYVPIVQRADRLWEELEQASGRVLRTMNGCLLMGPPEHRQMATILESVSAHGLDHEVIEAADLARRFPQFRLEDGDVALLDKRAGAIRPELSIISASMRAEELGAVIHRASTVTGVRSTRDGAVVETTQDRYSFDRVVVTVGPWVEHLLGAQPTRVQAKRPISAWFVTRGAQAPAPDSPAFIRTSPIHFYGVPSSDGISTKIGLSVPFHPDVEDPSHLDREVTLEDLKAFEPLLRNWLPSLHPDPIRVQAYMEGYSEDGAPLVGRVTGAENVIVMGGFSGHGFKLSPAFGDIGADLALDGKSDQPIEFLNVNRTPSPSAP